MQAFTTLRGPAAWLPQANIDTDVIIRIERLASVERAELGRYAFEALRYQKDGSDEPTFILNQPLFRKAPVLIVGPNFGCGSSREGAVWAMLSQGIRCVVGESFGDIFYANCFQNGVLPLRFPVSTVARIAELTTQGAEVAVDLVTQTLTLPNGEILAFEIDPMRRESLLEGLDEIGRTLKRNDQITAWQEQDRKARPWSWL